MALILVADDSWVARLGLSKLLTSLGHQVHEASSGQSALEMIQNQPPDLLFLDLLMPDIDGFAVLEALKRSGAQFPVYVISADIQQTTRATCLSLGVRGFLNKPPARAEIELVLESLA